MVNRDVTKIIEWDEDGYPTAESLQRLHKVLQEKDYEEAIAAFYAACNENRYQDYCGPERIEVRGEVIDVWGYHTGGWSGNEDIIAVLEKSWLFGYLLERYDKCGHYYFKFPKLLTAEEQKERGDGDGKQNIVSQRTK